MYILLIKLINPDVKQLGKLALQLLVTCNSILLVPLVMFASFSIFQATKTSALSVYCT